MIGHGLCHKIAWLALLAAGAPAQPMTTTFQGLVHRPTGSASLSVRQGGAILAVRNIGSSGLDGVRASLRRADAYEARWRPLGPASQSLDGSRLELEITGYYGTQPNRSLGALSFEDVGNRIKVTADFTGLSSPTQRLEFYRGGALVHLDTGTSGDLFGMEFWPGTCRKPRNVNRLCWGIGWDRTHRVTLPNGTRHLIDEVAILSEVPAPAVLHSHFNLTAKDLAGLDLTKSAVLRDYGPATSLGAPSGLDLDVQSIVRSATGVDYPEMFGVESNATSYFITAAGNGSPHVLLELDVNGQFITSHLQPAAVQRSPNGLQGLTTDGTWLWAGTRSGTSLHAFHLATRQWDPTANIPIGQSPIQTPRALAFNPNGNQGSGSFWVADPINGIFEIDRQSHVLHVVAELPGDSVGLAWNARPNTLGIYSLAVAVSQVRPMVQELDPSSGQWTGQRFLIDSGHVGLSPRGAALRVENDLARYVLLGRGNSMRLYAVNAQARYGVSSGPRILFPGGGAIGGNASFSLQVAGAHGSHALLLMSLAPANTYLPGLIPEGTELLVQVPAVAALGTSLNRGEGLIQMPLPSGIPEGDVFFQWWIPDPILITPGQVSEGGGLHFANEV